MPVIDGVTLRVLHAGYHYKGRMDLTVATFAPGTSVAGVLTQSACAAPEIEWCRERLPSDSARALVVSAGNSNAFTGKRGRTAAKLIGDTIADVAGCSSGEVYLAATGVIGVPLPAERAVNGLRALDDTEPAHWEAAAEAIQTTDTFAKGASATARVGTDTVTVAGIAKGSGMIA
ncbi:MAG: bifunctional ornithine acetyltransferase/N-acetylglutamate synthase, partial [Pseudomonadota bacterium]